MCPTGTWKSIATGSIGAKVLVIQPTDSAAAAAYVGRAHAAGAKVVAYDRSINGGPDFYVAHDSHKVGVLQAEAAGNPADPETLGKQLADSLRGQGADAILSALSA